MNGLDVEMNGSGMEVMEATQGSEPARRSQLTVLLDRVIVVLMITILLLLSWPICQVVWQQSQLRLSPQVMSQPAPTSTPTPTRSPAQAVQSDVL